MTMRRIAVSALGLLAFGCTDRARLEVVVMDSAACAAFCVDRLRVTALGKSTEVDCGDPIDLGLVPVGEDITLVVEAVTDGPPLTVTAVVSGSTGEMVTTDLLLAPTDRPTVTSINVERQVLLGDTPITITGEGFGARRGDSGVTVEGVELVIDSWTDGRIEARSSKAGDLVVRRCGVPSDPKQLVATEVDRTIIPTPTTNCVQPRMVAADSNSAGANEFVAAFACGAGSCLSTEVVQMSGIDGSAIATFDPITGCPIDIAVSRSGTGYLVISGNVLVIENDGTSSLAPRAIDPNGAINYVEATVPTDTFAVLVGVRSLLWSIPTATSTRQRSYEDVFDKAVAVDGKFILGSDIDQQKILGEIERDRVIRVHDVDCLVPRLLTRRLVGAAQTDQVMVTCSDRVVLFDVVNGVPLAVVMLDPGGSPIAAAMMRDGPLAVIYRIDGRLTYVNFDEGWARSSSIETTGSNVALIRAPESEHFYLTGPEPGQIIRINLE